MAKIDIETLKKKQLELVAKIVALQKETDGERIAKLSEPLVKEAKKLEALAMVLAHESQAKFGEAKKSARVTKVRLTDEQVSSVQQKTGSRVEVVEIPDKMGSYFDMMPEERPPAIERLAIEQVLRAKIKQNAEERARQNGAAALADMRKQDNPDLNKQIDAALKDPEFMAGLFKK